MMLPKLRHIGPAQILPAGVVGLAAFGVGITARATWVVAHGGDSSFEGMFRYPAWSTLHFVPALMFTLILPLELWPGSRRRFPRFHRLAGRVAAVAGALFCLTGFVLPYVMPARPFSERAFMTTVSGLFAVLLGLGVMAARRRDFIAHRQWMLRVTAVALGPLTQRAIFPFFAAAGIDGVPRFWDLFMSAAWFSLVVNVVIVEWWIRRTAAVITAQSRHPRGIAVAVPMG
jgi:predicted membrane protein DUF2306